MQAFSEHLPGDKRRDSVGPSRREVLRGAAAAAVLSYGARGIGHALASRSAEGSSQALEDLAARRLGAWANKLRFETMHSVDGLDAFEIASRGGNLLLRGSSPVAQARALNYYLREYCHSQISWTGDQIRLPAALPRISGPVRGASPYKYRYYLNYCTFGYTMPYWQWDRWERHLDWMALTGINLALAAVIGQETLWRNVLRQMQMSEAEIRAFLTGICYVPWMQMGNMEQWGGHISDAVLENRVVLQQKILGRMRELGIEPVLQGFYGMVPTALKRHYPDAKIISTGNWNGFVRPDILVPGDPLFARMAGIWYEEQERLFGRARYFGGDPFHEGKVEDIDLQEAGAAIHSAMRIASPGAIWVLQGWLGNPSEKLLAGTVKEATLILDLSGEAQPEYKQRDGFRGHPWLWCIVNNFGGKVGMYGQMGKIAQDPLDARSWGRMQGVGAMMEGIITDYPVYELLYDMGWTEKPPDLSNWARNYALQRYGVRSTNAQEAWLLLKDSVFGVNSNQQGDPESIFCARPGATVHSASTWGTMKRDYDPRVLQKAQKLLFGEAYRLGNIQTYRFDITNVTRQVLANLGLWQYQQMVQALDARDASGFRKQADLFLGMIVDQDRLVATQTYFLFGKWIADARAWGSTQAESDQLEHNARTLLTLWGPKDAAETLHDYANREWAGLLGDFYHARWKIWSDRQEKKLHGEELPPFDWYAWESAWTRETNTYAASPVGDSIAECRRVTEKYSALAEKS